MSISRWIWVFTALGTLRVLIFAAAYPVFDFIDEASHYDAVLTFARVGLPGAGQDHYDPQGARAVATFGLDHLSPPYYSTRDTLPPAQRVAQDDEYVRRMVHEWRNGETFSPPLYYMVAAAWLRAGRLLRLNDFLLVYWVRLMSAPLYGATIYVAGITCARFFRRRPEIAIGVCILLVVWPQDILYTVNPDVLCPLAGAVALFLLLRWMCEPTTSIVPAVVAGLTASLAMLVWYSNVGPLAALAVVILVARPRRPRQIAAALLAAALPVGLWMIRCRVILGDWTATRDRARMFDWTPLTLSQSLHHPIFTPFGIMEFLQRLCVTFWRGELIWNDSIQHVRAIDTFYIVVTVIGILSAMGWLLRPSPQHRESRRYAAVCLAAVAAPIVFLAFISCRYDYGHCFFPSRGFPYFGAGRLIAGAMVPFAILLVGGMSEVLCVPRVVVACATLVAIVCIASEIYLCTTRAGGTQSVFSSPYNLYHTRRSITYGVAAPAAAGDPDH